MRVLLGGGGNAVHVLAGLLSNRGHDVRIFAPYRDEAEKWNAALKEGVGVKVNNKLDGSVTVGDAGKVNASADPKDVVPGSQVILLPVPKFALGTVVRQMGPHIDAGTFVGGLPGQGGYHWIVEAALGKQKFEEVITFGTGKLPWNCRIKEYACEVDIIGVKRILTTAAVPTSKGPEAAKIVEDLLHTPTTALLHILVPTLQPSNQIIHPGRLYGLFSDYVAKQDYPENPLFYEEMDDVSAEAMDKLDREMQSIMKKLESERGVQLSKECLPVRETQALTYKDDISDPTTVRTVFSTNKSFNGLRCPMNQLPNGRWVPNFQNRYFTEDIPFGLCLLKGLAELVGVATPFIDEVVCWAQKHMGKEYIVDGKLVGKDAGECGSPQAYGFHTVEEAVRI